MHQSPWLTLPVALVLVAGLVGGLQGVANAAGSSAAGDRSVPVSPVKPSVPALPAMSKHAAGTVTWPTPASAVIDVPAAGSRPAPVVVGGLPVTVTPVPSGDVLSGQGMRGLSEPAPARVRIEVLDRAVASRGGAPVGFKIFRADGGTGAAKVHLEVDTSAFRHAFGGAYLSRLGLRLMPECGLSAVSEDQARRGACAGVTLESVSNFATGVVSADIDLNMPLPGLVAESLSAKQQAMIGIESEGAAPSGGGVVMMSAGGQADGIGTFGKTDLKESSTWAAGDNTGNFSYDYPLSVPPVPGNLEPDLSLDYSSATVDGQTAAQHIQSGLLGEGWSLTGAGFIESTFRPCGLDTDHSPTWTNATSDPCWRHENYQLSWSGRSGELVPTGVANTWKVASDDAAKVEYLGAEGYWRLTNGDGTQFYFGRQRLPGWTSGARETGSLLTQEMFANHSGEPCFHASGYTYSHCTRAYRWLLDYVVDPNGNSMSYWYSRFSNLTGSNNSGQGVFSYHRDAVLDRIEYGTRIGNETTVTPPAVVEFTNADRCVAADCNPNVNWPDTPWDLKCDAAPCNNNLSPTYWTSRRLSKITAKVWTGNGTTYKHVDEWTLGHSFPGGTDVPTLWLDSVTRKGFDANSASITLPALTTHGRIDRNRADYDPNAGMADPQKYRIDYLDTETGGRIEVSYLPTNEPGDACTWWSGKTESQWPNYNHNASRCYMQWVTNRSGQQAWSWWHKFVVDKVTEKDLVGGSPDQVTSYQYAMDGATSNHPLVLWGYTTSVWASPKKAMSAWKGYPTVITTVGAAAGTQSKTKRVYYRGLDRDTGLDPGQEFWRQASVVDSLGTSMTDHQALGGQVREEIVYNGTAGPEISKTIHTASAWQTGGGSLPSWQTPPERIAYMNRETSTKTLTKIADGSWRTTETVSAFDTTFGTPTQVDDKGQTSPALATDDVCTRYTYVRNTQDLTLRLGTGSGLVGSASSVMSPDWSVYDFVFSPGDFNGDGNADVLARNSLTTNLYMFTGNGAGGFTSGPTEVGWGWTDMDFIFSPGDFSGDGAPDVLFRRPSTTNLYMIKGNGAGSWTGAITEVGWGWTDMDRIFSPGDLTGDGKNDVLFRRPSTGNLYYLAGNGAGSWTGAITQIGSGSWAAKDSFFGKGDVTSDGKTDLYMREAATGDLHLYPGTNTGTLGTPTLVGSGWNVYEQLLSAGDITADGKADIMARYGGARLTDTVSRIETVGVACASTPAYPADLVSDERESFDGQAHGAVPLKGLPTKTEQVKTHNGTIPTEFVATETGYDTFGRPLWSKDELGNQTDTLYTHDTAGLLTSVKESSPPPLTGAPRHETTTTFDVLRGQPQTVTDPNNKVTTAAYDPLGRVLKVWEPGTPTGGTPDVEYVYTLSKTAPSHVATKQLGPNGNQILSHEIYDGLMQARQTQDTAPDGKRTITDVQYDTRGLQTKSSVFYNNASGPTSTLVWPTNGDADIDRQIRYQHDGAERPIKQQLYKTNVQQFEATTVYEGDRIGVIPPAGGTVTQAVFDALGRTVELREYEHPTALTGPSATSTYNYDDADRLTAVTDPASNTWTYEYDLLGRQTRTVDPDAGTSTATYDNAGQLLSHTDARTQVLFYEYDNLGRKTKQRRDTVGGQVMSDWVYDTVAKGHLSSTSRYDGSIATYTSAVGSYDDGYRPLSTTHTMPGFGTGGGVLTYGTTYTYKTNGDIASIAVPGVGGLPAETLTHTYSDTGYAKTLTGTWAGGSQTYVADTSYKYDGLLDQQVLGSAGKQVKLTNSYFAATRRLSMSSVDLETATPGTFTTKYSTDYLWDDAGNLTYAAGMTDGVRDQVECFKYDHLRRMTEAWTQATIGSGCVTPQRTGADPYRREWSYDTTIGNRLTQTDRDPAAGDTTWIYQVGAAGGVKPHQVKKVDATGPKAGTALRTFGYDQAGNMTSRTTETGAAQTLTWDNEGHLGTVTQGTDTTTYLYHTGGQRLISQAPGKTTLYLPDGTELEKIGAADPIGTRYYGGIAVRDAVTGLKWRTANHQNTSVIQINPDDLTTLRRRYLPFGENRTTTPAGWTGTKGYVGGTTDNTELTHLGAREYDPTLGRFISIDPIFDLDQPQQWHGYAYTENNPTTYSDADGLVKVIGDSGVGLGGALLPGGRPPWRPPARTNPQRPTRTSGGPRSALEVKAQRAKVDRQLDRIERSQTPKTATPKTTTPTPKTPKPKPTKPTKPTTKTPKTTTTKTTKTTKTATPSTTNSKTPAPPVIKSGAADGQTAGRKFPQTVRDDALKENPSTCVYCRMETSKPQVDHAKPRSRGGDATFENAQTTCPWCNSSKGARDFPVNPPPGYVGAWPPPWWGIR